jgi:hypothetical protein
MTQSSNQSKPFMKLSDQFRFHSVAIISLFTAIIGVSFNILQTSWIEENATRRDATFESLLALGELQEIVHFAHFKMDGEAGDPIMAMLLQPKSSESSRQLKVVWQAHFDSLDESESELAVSEAIRLAREEVLMVLQTL